MQLIMIIEYCSVVVSIFSILKMQTIDFYRRHDPIGNVLKYGMVDDVKAFFCAIIIPLGIALIIRNAVYMRIRRKK